MTESNGINTIFMTSQRTNSIPCQSVPYNSSMIPRTCYNQTIVMTESNGINTIFMTSQRTNSIPCQSVPYNSSIIRTCYNQMLIIMTYCYRSNTADMSFWSIFIQYLIVGDCIEHSFINTPHPILLIFRQQEFPTGYRII